LPHQIPPSFFMTFPHACPNSSSLLFAVIHQFCLLDRLPLTQLHIRNFLFDSLFAPSTSGSRDVLMPSLPLTWPHPFFPRRSLQDSATPAPRLGTLVDGNLSFPFFTSKYFYSYLGSRYTPSMNLSSSFFQLSSGTRLSPKAFFSFLSLAPPEWLSRGIPCAVSQGPFLSELHPVIFFPPLPEGPYSQLFKRMADLCPLKRP